MTWKLIFAAALAAALLTAAPGCSAQAGAQGGAPAEEPERGWTFPEGPAPESEYERAFWYGFAPEDGERDGEAGITEREMVDLLTAVIAAAGGDVEGWEELTAQAAGEEISRDYGAMLLLYAAERLFQDEVVYRFTTTEPDAETPEDSPFRLPDGSLLTEHIE